MENISKVLVDLFKDDAEYIKENKINKEVIYAKAYSYDENFLRKILGENQLRSRFFKDLDGISIFKITEFISFVGQSDLTIREKSLENGISYTFYEDKARLNKLKIKYKDNLLLKMSKDIDYKFKTKFRVSYLKGDKITGKLRLGDVKLYKEEESFEDTRKIANLKYKSYNLLKEDFKESSGLISVDYGEIKKLKTYITVFSSPSYYLNMLKALGKENTRQVLTDLNDLILKDSDYFENKNMGYHTIIKDSLLREFDGFNLSFLKIANVLNDFKMTDKIFEIFALINKKLKKYPDLNIIYEFIAQALEALGNLDFNGEAKSKNFYKSYLTSLEYEFRDSLNIFEKLNNFYRILPQDEDNLRRYEEAISYDIDRIVELLTVKPSDYEKLKDAENRISIGHYTSLDILGYLIDGDIEEIDQIYRNKLRLTNARMMNDPMEGKAVFEYLNDGNEDYINLNNYGNNKIYLLSASNMADSLPMWKQYADDTKGVFLEFSKEFIKSIINDKKIKLVKVFYIGDKAINYNQKSDEINGLLKKLKVDYKAYLEKISETLNKDSTNKSQLLRSFNNEIFLKLDKISYYFKKDSYAYEGEYRIVVDLDEDESRDHFKEIKYHNPNFPLPFLGTYLTDYELRYQRLIFGPKAIDKDYLVPYIKYCLGKDIETVNSKIKYR
ncbi:hypothetical protein HMPREF0072_1591 [Anaerococcus lactolyticus ATCC 51172]|uniref:Type III restriction/modification enzyme methylation subunit domain-containing protein n=1 Tax=Anaerococcus lactolyticus ATCC 51172 TaxID=525254 RepID=C2BGX1_9FIRM|nr:DUF2971 domain-containing protein [Anaerococcus lactolyticus]EEI85834.1 hypothetical protein HMPREF0072_1591 [Anaerococcus lactolyticus ATCC 51172]